MFITDLFGNPIYPAGHCDRPDDAIGNGLSYRDLALVVRTAQIPLFELLDPCGLEAAPIIARLEADGTLDENLNPVAPIDCAWSEETEELEAALLSVFARQH
jgi:hypothetical protein